MFGKPKLGLALFSIVTFCVVTVVVVDAVIPFGFLVQMELANRNEPMLAKVILLAPMVGLLGASFFDNSRTRGILTGLCSLCLMALWLIGIVLYVVYPPYQTEYPSSAKAISLITSIPFVVATVVTLFFSTKNVFAKTAGD